MKINLCTNTQFKKMMLLYIIIKNKKRIIYQNKIKKIKNQLNKSNSKFKVKSHLKKTKFKMK
jgi:hypothetical protein